jgi:site-specific DNA recombinase
MVSLSLERAKLFKYSRKARIQHLRLLDDIEAGRIDAVAIWMEDRLQRQVLELAEFLKVCDDAGVIRIASIGGEFDLSDPEQRTMLYIKAAMAEAEVEKLRRRVLRQRLKQRRTARLMEADGGGSGSPVQAGTGSPQSRSSKSAS